ncbi:MAG: 50S ribosomal protein L4 [Verrucomicrobiota bacterium]
MAANVLTLDDAKSAQLEVVEGDKGSQAVHDVVVALRANRRSGTANTKTRGEVRGSDKKPWKQKGTGRARAGSKKSPIWTGGGVVFGPRPRDYSKKVTRNTARLALRKVLTERIAAGDILLVDEFGVREPKTKQFVSAVSDLTKAATVLIVSTGFEEATYLAGRNVGNVLLMTSAEVNVEQLLASDQIILTQGALTALVERSKKS